MYRELYEKISQATGVLTVFLGEEMISQGSCFCFLPNGVVMTAAHVVTGCFPIKQEDVYAPDVKYFIKFRDLPVLEYRVDFCAITVHVEPFTQPIQIDLAMLLPKDQNQFKFPVIDANCNPPSLGEEVFIAGYSDELELPFLINKIMNPEYAGAKEFLKAMEQGYMADMTGPLIKRAVVGNVRRVQTSNTELQIELNCDVIYLDNGMHSGASGGPLVNRSGNVVGIITQRAVTNASQSNDPSLKVPSGSTVAISLQPLLVIEQLKSKI